MMIQEIRKKVEEDPDFVNLKRFDYSLAKLLERYPDGCPAHVVAHALAMTEEDAEDLYAVAVAKLKILMGVKDN